MNLLSTDTLAPAGDIAASPQNAPQTAGKEQSADTGFSGMLKSSLRSVEAESPQEVSQVVDLKKVNASMEMVTDNQMLEAETVLTDQISAILVDQQGSISNPDGRQEDPVAGLVLDPESNLLQVGPEQLATDESGIGLPPVAAAAMSQLVADSAVVPVATQMSGKPAVQAVGPVQVVMSQGAGVAAQADLSSGQQGNQNGLQQSANPLPAVLPDSGGEQTGVDFKLNTVLPTSNNQGSGSPVLNTPTVVAAGNLATPASAVATPLMDSSSVSLQSMSLGRGETSADVGNGLAERVQWMVNHKQNVAHIRLDPPLLGKLDVQVKVMDDVATITIQTQQGMTRDMIDAASHRLREALQESGFENVNVDVSHREDPGQTPDDQPTGPFMQAADDVTETDDVLEQLPVETWANGYRVSGMVDTFA